MTQLPLISVIVPVYKVENYLDCCVQSIVNQTYSNLEIILIDDGSPDASGACVTPGQKKTALDSGDSSGKRRRRRGQECRVGCGAGRTNCVRGQRRLYRP